MIKIPLLIIGGMVAGFINGLLGTGGGIVLIFMLNGMVDGSEKKDVFANVLAVTAVLSLISLGVYWYKGGFSLSQESIKYGLAAILGGFFGAYLLDRLKVGFLKKLFAFLVVFAGLNMAGVF